MLKIDPSKSKVLRFKMNISGNQSNPVAKFSIPSENRMYEIGFKGIFKDGKIEVNIPVLKSLYEKLAREGKLEVIVDGYFFEPWKDSIEFQEYLQVAISQVEEPNTSSILEVKAVFEEEPVKKELAKIAEKVEPKPEVKPVSEKKEEKKKGESTRASKHLKMLKDEFPNL